MEKSIFIYVTMPSEQVALQISEVLLEERLIACANIYQMQSVYRWKGKVEQEPEHVLVGKTREAHYPTLCERITRLHPYEVPCIAKLPVAFNPAFGAWVQEETEAQK